VTIPLLALRAGGNSGEPSILLNDFRFPAVPFLAGKNNSPRDAAWL
jgi:hypothetical protein